MAIDKFLEKIDKMKGVNVYVDGACKGNPGPGGYGIYIEQGNVILTFSGRDAHTTNNRMELMGAIVALENLPIGLFLTVYTDSNYVKMGITSWIKGWKKKGWQTSCSKPVKNQDLWIRLDELSAEHKAQWEWIRGHSGCPGNEQADALAKQAIIAQQILS
jgi:ribonuclease HI